MKTIEIHSHLEIDVRRTNGQVETVILKRSEFSPREHKACVDNTKNAGRGDVIAVRSIKKLVPDYVPTAAEIASDVYHAQRKSIERMGAGGEVDETTARADNTPAHKSDY